MFAKLLTWHGKLFSWKCVYRNNSDISTTSMQYRIMKSVTSWPTSPVNYILFGVPRHFSLSVNAAKGHSHWQNIRHTKGANDALRSNKMQRIAYSLRTAARIHGSVDPKQNSVLAKIIESAKNDNLPSDRIKAVLAKISANKETVITVEAKGPSGSLMIIELLTDSVNKSKQEMRSITKKFPIQIADGANSSGIRFNFEEKGIITASVEKGKADMDKAEEDAIEAGAEDVEEGESDSEVVFICDPLQLSGVTRAVEQKGYSVLDSAVEWLPKQMVELNSEAAEIMDKFMDALEQREDFSKIFRNW